MQRLADPEYMAFPLRMNSDGVQKSQRSGHVREQIEQVLFTDPRERVFRPEFGAGIRRLIFEPNGSNLWRITKKRLMASLTQALYGEVDPKTLKVDVFSQGEKLIITISYVLAAIRTRENHSFEINMAGGAG